MSSQADQRMITTLDMIANTASTTLQVLERMDMSQQAGLALSEAILETLKSNGGGGGKGIFGKIKNFSSGLQDAGISTLKDMKEAAEILPKLAMALVKFKLLTTDKVKATVIDFITKFRAAIAGTDGSRTDFDNFGKGFTAIAGSLSSMAMSMFLFAKIAGPKTQAITLDFIKDFVTAFGNIDMDKIEQGGAALSQIATSLAVLAISLIATSALMVIAAPLASLVLIPIVAGMALLFGLVGKYGTDIDKGAFAISVMSVSIAMFALSMWATSKLDGVDLPTILKLAAGISIMAIVFGVAGIFAPEIAAGGAAMLIVSLSVVILAAGLAIFKSTNFTLADTGVLLAVVLGIGVVFGLAGLASPFIAAGGLAMIFAGVGLAALSIGLMIYKALDFKQEDIESLKFLISGVGESFAVIGKDGFTAMLNGAIGIGAAGLSLILFSAGLWVYRKMEFKDEDINSLNYLVTSVGKAFGDLGILGSASIIAGAVAIGAAGISLVFFSAGLWVFRKMDFKTTDSANLKTLIDDVALAFSSIGVIGAFKMAAGSAAIIAAGLAIVGISAAVWAFRKINFTPADQANMISVLTMVTAAFKQVYDQDSESVSKGIKAVKNAGSVLYDLAKGVQGFADLNFVDPKTGKNIPLTPADLLKVGLGISLVLTAVSGAFAEVGKTDDAGYFTTGFVGKGIKALKGVGDALGDLAKGVQSFANLNYVDSKGTKIALTKDSFAQVKDNIVDMVNCLTSVFAAIGGSESKGENEGGFFSRKFSLLKNMALGGPVERGLKAVRGIGAEILPIAQAVQMFVNTKFDPTVAANIGKGISSMINQLMMIQVDPKKSEALNNMGRFLTRLSFLQKPLEGVNSSIKGIVSSLERLYSSISKVGEKSLENASILLQSVAALTVANSSAFSNNMDYTKNALNYSLASVKDKKTPAPVTPLLQNIDKATPAKPNAMGEKSTKKILAPVVTPQMELMQQTIIDMTASMDRMASQMAQVLIKLGGTINVMDVSTIGGLKK